MNCKWNILKSYSLKQIVCKNDLIDSYIRVPQIVVNPQFISVCHANGVAYTFTHKKLPDKLEDQKSGKASMFTIYDPIVNINTEANFQLAELMITQNL